MFTFGAALALSGILAVGGQIISDGQCDTSVQPMAGFDLEGYLGLWYEISRTPNAFQSGHCATARYTLNEETDQVEVYNNEVIENFYSSISGTARFEGAEDRGALLVNFPSAGPGEISYWVVDAYNDLYSLVYSCTNISPQQRSITMWKLSRTPTMTENTHAFLDLRIKEIDGISPQDLVETYHSTDACYLLPELDAGAPVVLTGQCDPNLPVVQDFDIERYMDLWHDISSYANEFQYGTCSNARYTLTENGVDVLNSQVVSQSLDTISGAARFASEDGTAKLIVTFPDGAGGVVESDYWILGTDYDNYALVYSCVNLNEDEMRVWSWKLSRTKQLSPESSAAIDAITRDNIILNDRYYEPIDQTDDSCFYLPEPVLNQPVTFPGQCDELIPAKSDFDLERYSGLWHDFESYDSDFMEGTCSNAFYSVTPDNEVEVTNSQVVNQRREPLSGVGRVVSEDGSAKMVVTFPVDGTDETVEANYWVLDTDYDNYALVYSCRNTGPDRRLVHSWKLSRAKELPAASGPIIDAIVAQIPVLNQQYYRRTDQSDGGCFYFPYAEAGLPVVFPGQCDESVAVVQDFDVERYSGTWHDISSYPSFNQDGQCTNALYTLGEDGVVEVINTQVAEGFLETITGTAVLDGTDGSAKLTVTFPPPPGSTEPVRSPYWVLATNYDSYALVYSCTNINAEYRAVFSWKLSRTKQMSAASNAAIHEAMEKVEVVDEQYFQERDQSDEACFFLPDLAPGEPVVIVGQCDPAIAVVQNFDLERYTGLWHDIASYYTEFQDGTCNDARYTILPDDTIEVHNSQVIGQSLDTVTGTATLATADNSGKLLVTFPIAGTDGEVRTADYWILDTDYDTYSLVYSCENINADSRRVRSWKMSRTRALSDSANTAINAVINTVPVLTNQFYIQREQTNAACFYLPEPVAGQPVTFRGQCDDTISAVANFDATRYAGLWYDIGKYPSIFQGGTCNNALYTLTTEGTVDVINTQVVNEQLESISGVATLHPDETTGRLTVTFPIAGTDQYAVSNYWVLDTDYDGYSIVYSCENIGSDRQAVWSWKLSRDKELSEAAMGAIEQVVDRIPVLDRRYFEHSDQTDDGCFYYPEPVQDLPVVFPGQCDVNVPVMEDFNLERYAGLWHHVESYPSTSQVGTCNRERYTPTSGGVAEVVNTQVLNQRLDTIRGTLSPSTDDGGRSGRFTVTRTVPGTDETTESSYWVLDTDYDSYALVYSCENMENHQRAVWSWKLSRTTSLTAAANTAIDEAIRNVQVLDPRYYQLREHNDACFYLPYLNPNEPVVFVGQCDVNIPVVAEFDPVRYSGLWHEAESYYSEFQGGTCNNARYTLNAAGTVDVLNTQVVGERLDTIRGVARIVSEDQSGKLEVEFPVMGSDVTVTTDYWVLSTDYDNYALVYTCVNIDDESRQVWSWKLSRTKELTPASVTAINAVVDTIPVLDPDYYNVRDQTNEGCFYFPVHNIGQPIVFPGRCDENVQVVQSFDVEAYLGPWHDVESYPQEFQAGGTCANALYTANEDGSVGVLNTHVVEQALMSITGSATLAGDSGEAKLIVRFPIPGSDLTTESPYWVLATDYLNYALVYSCTNIQGDRRSVTSWKLSRQPTLSPEAIEEINLAMSVVQVLSEEYFDGRGQTDDDCFFYPEPVEDLPVVFPGQCDVNVPVMEDFDLEKYAGLWHHVESYPSTSQVGTCNRERYTPTSGGVAEVVNTQVLNQRLDTIRGTLSPSTDDGGRSGRFTVTRTVPGTDETTESSYWVLDTDYDSYALVYSCENMENHQRAVWSWKLSRTTSLTAAANTAIDEAIRNVQVLDPRYYQLREHNDACFYLPYLNPNEPVVFVGQCDVNIPVVAEFDPVRYSGLWHEAESYYSEFQGGTCNNARYTLNAAGTVDVLNTQVVGERLDTIRGVARIVSEDQSGKLEVEFPVMGSDVTVTTDYWVLSTDYDNYALVYTCVNMDDESRQVWSWKLSRTKELTPASVTAINAVVDTIPVLDSQYYNVRDQSNEGCFYFPDHIIGQPVVFPGRCDENVQVVQSFDVEAYLGPWYDVESYPQQFQAGGTCANALYTANEDGSVGVLNTHVVEQRLQSITGSATLAGDSGEAKLIVRFPIPGSDLTTESPYWVLATDYLNYALVYSCSNIEEDRRSVTSWKLSRQPTLSPEAIEEINLAMSEVQVVSEEYFVERGQTDADCFFYPDNNGGPVILDGHCDDDEDVPALNGFNFNQYLGDWYEVARFPSELQTGQCARERIQAGNVVHTIVDEELLRTAEGQINVNTDGRAAFTVTFPSQGGAPPVSTRYYVLDTDYSTFSLVFSCRNLEDEKKQVYSWKLSRSREGLSPIANERIDETVTSYVDLFQDYYDDSDQGDAACFYYPEFSEPPAEVVLPGPCNNTISPMAGLQLERYLGRWFEFARYPQELQVGECARTEYSQDGGVVAVVNTIVSGEELEEELGTAALESDGRLRVTYTSGSGVTRETYYYVLTTDYDNYALVYSCNDLANGDRQVTSWKLGRQSTWNPANDVAIAPVIERTQGLLEDYYVATAQTDEACFYVPELDESEAPVYRGQCEEVQGVTDFDAQSYMGWWHELQHFPSGYETGDCLSSRYEFSNGQYSNVNTSVNGLEATVVSNNLVIAANAPGRLRKTLDNQQVVDIWVLATDYESYSLLYFCENVSDENRRVWSAVHSKARVLTAEALAAMGPFIESNQVLQPQFYLPVDQTDEACFHYPALSPGELVTLPGQCDESIPVVQGFEFASYSGVWHHIQRYPHATETGSCTAVRYTLDVDTGEVTVVTSEVVDGEQVVREGTAVASADGSGRITVTYPGEESEEPTTTVLHVLDTNYNTYALVYSCTNVNQFQRAVGSWKLGREQELSSADEAAITLAMASHQVLHQPYFVDVEHNEDCPTVPGAATALKAIALMVALAVALLNVL